MTKRKHYLGNHYWKIATDYCKPSFFPKTFNIISIGTQRTYTLALKRKKRASLVAQWLRICLPMQGTRVRALVWEDPTCRGATRPVSHNY